MVTSAAGRTSRRRRRRTGLPSGLVTFVFTDIEGSTRLFRQLGPGYPQLLAEHRRVIRDALTKHDGAEVNTEGDGFLLAFGDAANAVRFAVAAQRSLAEAAWPHGASVRVRMGMHTGPAVPTGFDYIAMAVHQAARVAAAAHGGQIVVSDDTRARVGTIDGFTFIELGLFELKDFDGPQLLLQVSAAGLRHAFPPLRTRSAARHNLPASPTSFVGRAEEVAAVRALISGDHRLVSICGPGGVGKTRIALETAAGAIGEHRDGVWFVNLASVTDVPVAAEVAAALSLVLPADADVIAALVGALSQRDLIVVLDNCEHVRAGVSEVVAALLQGAPSVRILVTSQVPLGLPGERVWRAPCLAPEEAATLFRARAEEARGRHIVADDVTVEELCARLDGVPLAIELAAARARVVSAGEILRRLDDRFGLLLGGPHAARAPHQTLRALIDWSHDLLPADARKVLRRMSVFSGGATLTSIERVCGDDALSPASVLAALETLVDHSLVAATETRFGDMRYSMLESIRAYADEKLGEAGEASEMQARHVAAIAALSKEVALDAFGSAQDRWASICGAEESNVAAAMNAPLADDTSREHRLEIVAAMAPYWAIAAWPTLVRTAERWTRRAVEEDADRHASLAREATLGLAWLRQDADNFVPTMRAALAAPGDATPLYAAGFALLARHPEVDADEAEELLERSVDIANRIDCAWAKLLAGHCRAVVHLRCGRTAETFAELEAVVAQARADRILTLLFRSLSGLATLLVCRRDATRAEELAREALAVCRQLGGASRNLDETYLALGYAALLQRRPVAARRALTDSLTIALDDEYEPYVWAALWGLAQAALDDGDRHGAAVFAYGALRHQDRVERNDEEIAWYAAVASSVEAALGHESDGDRCVSAPATPRLDLSDRELVEFAKR